MIKRFFAFAVCSVVVSASAQGGPQTAVDVFAQVSSKETASADSAADERLGSSSQTDSSPRTDSLSQTDSSARTDSPPQTNSAEQNHADSADGALTLKINSDPPQAALKIGDRDYGLTPVTITDLGVGEHVLELSKSGHFRRRVTIQLDSTGADLHFELLRPASVFVTSEPEGALVNFDGKPSGVTPFKSERMRPGDYPLSLNMNGYKLYETDVSLKSGAGDTLNVTLEPLKPQVPEPQSETAQARQTSQPEGNKKSLFNKEYTRVGVITVAFAVFTAILIGVEKTSY